MSTETSGSTTGTDAGPERTLREEVERRRTFAIISHPDAGKTTLTEKLLLFGGALREAGAVRGRRAEKHATSDWLELEKQRGISVSSSVMHFDHGGSRVNILDTPGHKDFSEDTYRTLTAADSAVMLIDAAKGVEKQTRKLFEVCRMRGIPIFTFVNKMDRFGRDPLELMGEIEEVLGIDAVPVNWPVGEGKDFRGVYDRLAEKLILFSGGNHGRDLLDEDIVEGGLGSPAFEAAIGTQAEALTDSLELLDGAGAEFSLDRVRQGELTPMFFGSALTNFGVSPFLERFLEMAPCPPARESDHGPIDPASEEFSGFVFKIQANMDKDHRDRVAFVRVCSGRFAKGNTTRHVRTNKPIRMANSTLLMGRDRAEMMEAFPGDVVGLFDPGVFGIGDTLCDSGSFNFPGIPSFSPECFVRVEVSAVAKRKSLEKGIDQLVQEGAVQLFREPGGGSATLILGAVGQLQFDVFRHRLKNEYSVDPGLTQLDYRLARWPQGEFDEDIFRFSERVRIFEDRDRHPVLLAKSEWDLKRIEEKHPELKLAETADPTRLSASR
ncbi:MAG: peptide chain release factor 3 [Myxococcota bacterium]|jgi:peptide chain release factor 3|nr:peptide chain release factor 3 [Myxococcota bacterium]